MRKLRFLSSRGCPARTKRAFLGCSSLQRAGGIPDPTGPQGHGATGRLGHRVENIAAGAYVSLRPVGRGKLARGVAALLRQTSWEQRGFWFIFNCPRGIGGCSNLEAARQAGHG